MLFNEFSLDNAMKSAKIIIVDDNPVNRLLLEKVLTALSFEQVIALDSGQALLDHLSHDSADLILLDLFMPHLDGYHVLSQLQKDNYQIPTIVLSALEKEQAQERALALGAISYLEKPIQTESVLLTIIQVLSGPSPHLYPVNSAI